MAAVRQLYNRELTIGSLLAVRRVQSLICIAPAKPSETEFSYMVVCYPEKGGKKAGWFPEYSPTSLMVRCREPAGIVPAWFSVFMPRSPPAGWCA
jgi:hypothetical protein